MLFRTLPVFLLGLMIAAPLLHAEKNGFPFYDKKRLKPYFSFRVEGVMQQVDDLNDVAFSKAQFIDIDSLGKRTLVSDNSGSLYSPFASMDPTDPNTWDVATNFNPSFHFEAGVDYRQLSVAFLAGFSLPQTSVAPAVNLPGGREGPWDVDFYIMDFGIHFAWMVLDPSSVFNIVPSVQLGFAMINLKPWAPREFYLEGTNTDFQPYRYQEKYYTSSGQYIGSEVELRLRLGRGFSLGLSGGGRSIDYDRFRVEYEEEEDLVDIIMGKPNASIVQFYGALKLTFHLLSIYEKERLQVD